MKFKKNIFKASFLAILFCTAAVIYGTAGMAIAADIGGTSYCSTPPFLGNSVPPNVLILLDNSGSMNDQAYSANFNPTAYAYGYYGYFDPTKNYVYSTNNRWEITTAAVTTGTVTNPIANGNFLNWATTRKVDASKKLLIGGKASPRSPSGAVTVKLYGEDSITSWNFTKQYDSTATSYIYPFVGDYFYSMSGDQLRIIPVSGSSATYYASPTGNLSVPAAWSVVGTASAYDAVDDGSGSTPNNIGSSDGDSTRIQNTTTQGSALFTYNYAGGTSGVITRVRIYARAKKILSSGTRRLRGVVRVSGTDYPSNYSSLGTNYSTYSFEWINNPATNAAWQWSDINGALEGFGIEPTSSPSSSNYPVVTQVYMVVSTSTPTGGPFDTIIDQGMVKAEGIVDRLSGDVRFGLAYYNDSQGAHIENYVDFGSATSMVTSIQNMSPSTWTPLAESLYELTRYFKQDGTYYSSSDYSLGSTNISRDPYYYQYSKLTGSTLSDKYVPCAKSFVLMLTDGESTMDQSIPASLQGYSSSTRKYVTTVGTTYADNGTDYLIDVASWARTNDARPGACSTVPTIWDTCIPGNQNIIVYPIYMYGRGSNLLKDTAVNGGFNDLNGDGKPGPDLEEYLRDSSGDGTLSTTDDLPLTYFEGDDGYELEQSITNAIADIMKRAASGTAVSVLTTSTRGAGTLSQAYFLPTKQEGLKEIKWTGYLQSIWTDRKLELREDTVKDLNLKLAEDKIIRLFYNSFIGETRAALYSTDNLENLTTACNSPTIKEFSDINALWKAGEMLALRSESSAGNGTDSTDRKIFTAIPNISTGGIGTAFGTPFTVSNMTGSTTDCAGLSGNTLTLCKALNPDATYTADKIVKYIRGINLESIDANFRDRRVTVGSSLNVWKLGDIINSTPKISGNTPHNTYFTDYSDRTYHEFTTSDKYVKSSSMLFVGANDGMLHAFKTGYLKDKGPGITSTVKGILKNEYDSLDTENDKVGKEAWAYIPYNALPYLKYLATKDYCHLYYADLAVKIFDASLGETGINDSPTATKYLESSGGNGNGICEGGELCKSIVENNSAADGDNDGICEYGEKCYSTWRTILVGGMRFGGACSGTDANPANAPEIIGDSVGNDNGICEAGEACLSSVGFSSYFAIDITDHDNPVPLWEFTDPDLGYTSAYPAIMRTGPPNQNGNWYMVLGSGSKQQPKLAQDIGRTTDGYIYILDLKTGQLVKKINLGHAAIVGDLLPVDSNFDYRSERIYFGTSYKAGSNWYGKLMRLAIPSDATTICGTTSATVNVNYSACTADNSLITLFSGNYPFTASVDSVKDVNGKVWVFAGSGKYYSDLDEKDLSQQIFVGLIDDSFANPGNYPITEGSKATNCPASCPANALCDTTLCTRTGTVLPYKTIKVCTYDESTNSFSEQDVVTGLANMSSAAPYSSSLIGWKLYLPSGHKMITRPLAYGGILDFITYEPSDDICSSGGESYLYALDAYTGGVPKDVAIIAVGNTSATTGTVQLFKSVPLGPGAPPTGDAIIVPPSSDDESTTIDKKIQISTGVIVGLKNQPTFRVGRKFYHWLIK